MKISLLLCALGVVIIAAVLGSGAGAQMTVVEPDASPPPACATPAPAPVPPGAEYDFSRIVPARLGGAPRAVDVDMVFSIPRRQTVYLKGLGTYSARGVVSTIVREPLIEIYDRQGGTLIGTVDFTFERCKLQRLLPTLSGSELERAQLTLGLERPATFSTLLLLATPAPTAAPPTPAASAPAVSPSPQPSPSFSYALLFAGRHAQQLYDFSTAAGFYAQVDDVRFDSSQSAKLTAFDLYVAAGDESSALRISALGGGARSAIQDAARDGLNRRKRELSARASRLGATSVSQTKACIAANSNRPDVTQVANDKEIDPAASPSPHIYKEKERFDQDVLPSRFQLLFNHKQVGGEARNNLDIYRSTYLEFDLPGRVKGHLAVRLSHWTLSQNGPGYYLDYAVGEQTFTHPNWSIASLPDVVAQATRLKACIENEFDSVS